jgi:hypothetical protein
VKETLRHSQPMAAASVRWAQTGNIASNSNLYLSVEGTASPIGAMATRRATRGELILKFGGKYNRSQKNSVNSIGCKGLRRFTRTAVRTAPLACIDLHSI